MDQKLEGNSMKEEIKFEQVEKFYKYLQGEIPVGFVGVKSPRLSSRMAFHVIYILQEELRVIPDNIERCVRCGELYDTWKEGDHIGNGFYCGCCVGNKRAKVSYNQKQYRLRKKSWIELGAD
jgi:hypothetical protein